MFGDSLSSVEVVSYASIHVVSLWLQMPYALGASGIVSVELLSLA